ncbi:IS110 family transposase [Bradyrhizobium sp. USDA 3315]
MLVAMPWPAKLRHADVGPLHLLHDRLLLLIAEPTPVRPPVQRFRRQAVSASRAIGSTGQLSLGTRMKATIASPSRRRSRRADRARSAANGAIRSALEGYADRLDRVGVEASSLGIWLYRELQPVGMPIIVVEARHMRVSLSTMRNKTDRNDARGVAQMIQLGWCRAVHVKYIEMQKMRTLLANRKLLKRKLIDVENHIRGSLRAYGLLVGAVARGAYEARVRELIECSDPIFAMTIEAMLDVRRAILEAYDRLHRA